MPILKIANSKPSEIIDIKALKVGTNVANSIFANVGDPY